MSADTERQSVMNPRPTMPPPAALGGAGAGPARTKTTTAKGTAAKTPPPTAKVSPGAKGTRGTKGTAAAGAPAASKATRMATAARAQTPAVKTALGATAAEETVTAEAATPEAVRPRSRKNARQPAAVVPEAATPGPTPEAGRPPARPRRGFLGRRSNRRITVDNRSLLLWLSEALAVLARRLLVVLKVLAALGALAGVLWLGRLGVQHVVASPRFALREIRVGPAEHLGRDQIVAAAGVTLGDRLLSLDTDAVAARLARHPWITAARVRRELPSTLVIEVTERRAAAVAALGGLYLVDGNGHAFKPATLEEADGLVVVTGLSREQFAGRRDASESAFREALALLDAYQYQEGLATAGAGTGLAAPRRRGARPALSEIHIDPRSGFSLFFYDGGAEVRLGRDRIAEKLARLDQILLALGPRGLASLRVVHLDGPAEDRIPIRLAEAADAAGEPSSPASGGALATRPSGKSGASAGKAGATRSKSPATPPKPGSIATKPAVAGSPAAPKPSPRPLSAAQEVKKSTATHNPVISGKRAAVTPATPATTAPDLDTD
jgi:cell division protein FtsQ